MAKFNGLTLASNSALRALLAGTKTESDRNNAIAGEETALWGEQSFRKLIECLMGAWWIVWKS